MAKRKLYYRRQKRLKRTGTPKVTRCQAMVWSRNNRDLVQCKRVASTASSPPLCSKARHENTFVRQRYMTISDACSRGSYGGDIVEVKESNIPNAGVGIFTKLPILKGDYITEFDGEVFHKT